MRKTTSRGPTDGPVSGSRRGALSSLLVIAVLAAGCSGGSDRWSEKRPKLSQATGQVLYNSEPLADAVVTFHADGEPWLVYGRTDAQGRFELSTQAYGAGTGAPAGNYRVTVEKKQVTDSGASGPDDEGLPEIEEISLVPETYGRPGQTPLTAEVTSGGQNQFTFELTD
jgi:hypothetical protein